jgi:hypothetical protein
MGGDLLAKEAVTKIKEAEEAAAEVIRQVADELLMI